MSAAQKMSIYVLCVMLATAVAVAAILAASGNPVVACAGFALMSAVVCGRRFFREGEGPAVDERDAHLGRRAQLISYRVFWICFIAVSTAVPLALGANATVPSRFLILVPWAGAWLLFVARSAATLLLYARGA